MRSIQLQVYNLLMVKGVEWPVWQQLDLYQRKPFYAVEKHVPARLLHDHDGWLAAADDCQDMPENKENAEFAQQRMSGLVESRSEECTEN